MSKQASVLSMAASILGSVRSAKKARAARLNGQLGGRQKNLGTVRNSRMDNRNDIQDAVMRQAKKGGAK